MGRKGIILCSFLTITSVLMHGCLPIPIPAARHSQTRLILGMEPMQSKAQNPDETLISDVSILIFDSDGNAEECIWIPEAKNEVTVQLTKGNSYSIRACANFGYQVYADCIDELDEVSYYMAYPDEYREGIPMYAAIDAFIAGESEVIRLPFKKLMAKISLRMDRSRLSEDVRMTVLAARIGNCPKTVSICGPSRVSSHDQCFAKGFTRGEFETVPLNASGPDMISGEVSLYMLENMQGDISPAIEADSEKVFATDDIRSEICSYLELEMEYMSPSRYSSTKNLIYRFYLGDSRNNLDVERNCHYHITVRPEDDGLGDDGWRVDKSGLVDNYEASLTAFPKSYIRGDIGDKVHIWCELDPEWAQFDVGLEYMQDDKAEGIYDYEIDEDGHGATLTLTGPGTGLIYMEAGDPINDAALFIIEVNLPSSTNT